MRKGDTGKKKKVDIPASFKIAESTVTSDMSKFDEDVEIAIMKRAEQKCFCFSKHKCCQFVLLTIAVFLTTAHLILYATPLTDESKQQSASREPTGNRNEPAEFSMLDVRVFFALVSSYTRPLQCVSDHANTNTSKSIATRFQVRSEWNSTEFFVGPGLDDHDWTNHTTAAVCMFKAHKLNSLHFPHAMEQLYACFSWWQSHPTKESIMLIPRRIERHLYKIPFLNGFLRALQDTFQVSIVDNHSDPAVSVWAGPFRVRSPADFTVLRNGILNSKIFQPLLPATQPRPLNRTLGGRRDCEALIPRISILNRAGVRSLVNAPSIGNEIQSKLLQDQNVSIFFFEGKSFEEQVQMFASTDIIISPHGAQLTGLPFAPPCGSLLELFPPNFLHHDYFGALASSAGLDYHYMRIDSGENVFSSLRTNGSGHLSLMRRTAFRRVNLCPSPDGVVDAVQVLIDRWHQCICRRNSTVPKSLGASTTST
jgi:Glycosyltransferase 61